MAVDMNKRNVFLGKLVRELKAAVQSSMMAIGEKLGLYKDPRASRHCVTDWRKRNPTFEPRWRVISAAVLSCALFVSSGTYSQCRPDDDRRVALELANLGKQGDTIAHARRQVLEILQNGNACTAWFQEADPAPAEVFRSLHLALESKGPWQIYGLRDNEGRQQFKDPWAAESFEHGGRNSILRLNANGAFFKRASVVMQLDSQDMPPRVAGFRELAISSYAGSTTEAQITILLHELGHVIGRLPLDDDSWDGRSSRNTSEVLQHCKAEILAVSRNSPRGHTRATVPASNPK